MADKRMLLEVRYQFTIASRTLISMIEPITPLRICRIMPLFFNTCNKGGAKRLPYLSLIHVTIFHGQFISPKF